MEFSAEGLELARRLTAAKIPFVQQADVAGTVADFWVPTEDGNGIALEVKAGAIGVDQAHYLGEFAERLNRVSGGTHWLELARDAPAHAPSEYVVNFSDVVERIGSYHPSRDVAWKAAKSTVKRAETPIFASMPFADEYWDTYESMRKAALQVGGSCRRIDEPEYSGPEIPNLVREKIASTKVTICDLSMGKPNVLYELGFSDALPHPVVAICSTPPAELPLLVQHRSAIPYKMGQTTKLVAPLVEALKAKLAPMSPK